VCQSTFHGFTIDGDLYGMASADRHSHGRDLCADLRSSRLVGWANRAPSKYLPDFEAVGHIALHLLKRDATAKLRIYSKRPQPAS
jgi:hypothetical protein